MKNGLSEIAEIKKRHLILLVILSITTVIVWNMGAFSALLNYVLPGDVAHQSILSTGNSFSRFVYMLLAPTFAVAAPAVMIFFSTLIISRHKRIPEANKIRAKWYYAVVIANALFYLLLILYGVTGNMLFNPDIGQHFYDFYGH